MYQRLCLIVLAAFLLSSGLYLYTHTQDTKAIAELKSHVTELHLELDAASSTNAALAASTSALAADLDAARRSLDSRKKEVSRLDTNYKDLQKVVETDPQLLAKYSKVYFLNENYSPKSLVDIEPQYWFDPKKELQFLSQANPFLENLLSAAKADGVNLSVLSSYRSFGTQAALKQSYKVTYGAGTANSFSADQGYSEHQLGTAVDFTTASMGGSLLTSFDQTAAFSWLANNAYKYGFILSYPKGNSYYQYEPWHWRFVGLELGKRLHDDGGNFYDLDQRNIDNYLGNLFNE